MILKHLAKGVGFAVVALGNAACDSLGSPWTTAGANGEVAAWGLPSEPRMTIGVVDGDERYQFVRVRSAWKQANGRIVVLDPGKPALLFYDTTGTFIQQVGSRGEGPGEMQQLVLGWPYRGDSIATFDFILRRISIYDTDGRFVRSFNNPTTWVRKPGVVPSQSCCSIGGVLADGSFVGHPPDDIPTEPGPPRHSTLTPLWISSDGSRQATIGTFESTLFRHDPSRPNGIRSYATSYAFRYVIVGDQLVGGNGLADGLLAVRLIGGLDESGAPVSITLDTIPLPREAQPFTAELRSQYEEALRLDYEKRGGTYYEGSLESNMQEDYPAVAPRFVNIFADADDRIWLQHWTFEYGRSAARVEYDVITAAGRHVANIELPIGSRILWSRDAQVLLLERDTLDVQYIRLYDIVIDGGSKGVSVTSR